MSCQHPAIALRHDKKSAYCISCNAEMGERFAEERAENMALRFRFEDAMDAKDAEIARLKADNARLFSEASEAKGELKISKITCESLLRGARTISPEEFAKSKAGWGFDRESMEKEIARLKAELARLANENAALVAQLPNGFTFPRDGEARLIE